MRYILNRSLALIDVLDKEMDSDAVGTIDVKNRVLILSIQMAIKSYEKDMRNIAQKTKIDYAGFGVEYFEFLNEVNKSIFDASAQYNIQRISFEWLQWDLYRDLNNTSYAPQIVKINNALRIYPTKKISDAQSIGYIRQMKKVMEQLSLTETAKRILEETRLAQAASEAERKKILEERAILEAQEKEREMIRKMGPIISVVQTIPTPKIGGVPLSSTSNPNGTCIALGYQKAAGTGVSDGSTRGLMLVIDSQGKPIQGEFATDRVGYSLKEITCINKVTNYKFPKFEYVNAVYNGISYSSTSPVEGVCKSLGFETGIEKAGSLDGDMRGLMAIVDSNGRLVGGEVATDRAGYRYKNIVCMNKISNDTNLVLVPSPKLQGHILSSQSNPSGVCKISGYSKGGADKAIEVNGDARGNMLVLDATGDVASTELATDRAGYSISKIICRQ